VTVEFDGTSRKLWGMNPSGIWTPINTDANGNLFTSGTPVDVTLIASGSVAVPSGVSSIATGQQPQTNSVPKEYFLIFTGEIANTTVNTIYGQTYLATPLAGVDVAPVFSGYTPTSYGGSLYTVGLIQEYGNANIQVGGAGYEFVFSFAAATTAAANLDWQLYGYE